MAVMSSLWRCNLSLSPVGESRMGSTTDENSDWLRRPELGRTWVNETIHDQNEGIRAKLGKDKQEKQ